MWLPLDKFGSFYLTVFDSSSSKFVRPRFMREKYVCKRIIGGYIYVAGNLDELCQRVHNPHLLSHCEENEKRHTIHLYTPFSSILSTLHSARSIDWYRLAQVDEITALYAGSVVYGPDLGLL